MTPELKRYYEARIAMFCEQGWSDLMDDVREMEKSTNDISSVQDEKTLHFRRGELSMIRWILGIEQMSRDSYEELERENATAS